MNSKTGRRSTFGGERFGTRRVTAPWGSPIPKKLGKRGRNSAVRTRGSRQAKHTPDPQLWSMKYKANDPAAWPLEVPTTTAELRLESAMTQAKVDWVNDVTNHAFVRGGYAG